MDYKIVEKRAFKIVGMKYYGNNANDEIKDLWDDFHSRMGEVKHRINTNTAYGYDTWTDEFQQNGKFTYYAAVEVDKGADIPQGMDIIEIPNNKYAVFEIAAKDISDTLIKSLYTKWMPKHGLKLNGDYDFEYWEGMDTMYFHIPIK